MQAHLLADATAKTVAEDGFAQSTRSREADLRTGRVRRQTKGGEVGRLMSKTVVVDLFELSRPQ